MILSKTQLGAALMTQETRLRALLRGNQLDRYPASVPLLREAADQLDRLCKSDALGGSCDVYGGAEYQRVSLAPQLRALADRVEAAS